MNHNESLTYQLTIDPTPRSSKPEKTGNTIGIIHNNLNVITGLTISQFATCVSQPFGYTWTGGLFNGDLTGTNWQEQSIFALDFDKGLISVEQVFERLNSREIYPQVWYSTFSDSENLSKFRVVIFLDKPVIDDRQRKYIVDGLLTLFPEADPRCKNASRFFFGGKQSFIKNEAPTRLQKLVDVLGIEMITRDGGRTRKIPPELFQYSGATSGSGTKWAFLLISNRSSQNQPKIKTTSIEGGGLEIIDMNLAKQNVRILKEFLDGRWLYHDELFGLATNLIYINGGSKLMKETMEHYNQLGKTQYTPNNFNILTYLKKVRYPATPLYKFTPFPEDHEHHDIISATKEIRGKIELMEPIERMDLSKAEELLRNSFQNIIQHGQSGKIYLMCLPTAVGKTESIISTLNATIAAPTNSLKNEINGRMKINHETTPDPVEFENESITKRIQYYYIVGLPGKASAVIHDVANPKNSKLYSADDRKRAEKYLSQTISSLSSTDTVLTTHSRAIHSNFKHDTLIFDEDPLNHLIDIKQISLSDIFKLEVQAGNVFGSELNNVLTYLRSCAPGEIKSTPTFSIDLDDLIDKVSSFSIQSNIIEFFASSHFIRDGHNPDCFHYVVKRELPTDKKIIILSATLPVYIYEKLYGERLVVIDIRDVKQQGSVIQYTNRSCSRDGLKRYSDQISAEIGEKPVITFKSYSPKFKNPAENIHFGNCSGYDVLKGQNIAVVGTPHRNNIEYFLTAKVLGIDFKTPDTTMSYQKIEYNGFRFKFNCFDNDQLRKIQLALIESELIQAVGRARTLRTDARVEVYSNFPLRITDEFRF